MSTITSTLPTTSAPVSTPIAANNPVLPTSNARLSGTAVTLSEDSSIIANLGGSNSTTPLYTAVGLMNTYAQAEAESKTTTTSPRSSGPSTSAANEANASAPASSSLYTPNGSLTNIANGNWASIVSTTPGAAPILAADTFNQGIVSTL